MLTMINPDQQSQIDLTYLNTMADGDEDFIRTMIASFIKNVPGTLQNIKELYQEESFEDLASEIHKLKPMLKYLGIHSLNDLMSITEKNCISKQNFD
jgi:HPt (histidine-containing phosphotransfer) domain-containing protein